MQSDPLSLRISIPWRVVIPIALVALVIGATLVSIENWQC
jgi:NADH:ubiquinone oxidoreductase subunit H